MKPLLVVLLLIGLVSAQYYDEGIEADPSLNVDMNDAEFTDPAMNAPTLNADNEGTAGSTACQINFQSAIVKEGDNYKLVFTLADSSPMIESVQAHWSRNPVAGEAFQSSVPMTMTAPNHFEMLLPALTNNDHLSFSFTYKLQGVAEACESKSYFKTLQTQAILGAGLGGLNLGGLGAGALARDITGGVISGLGGLGGVYPGGVPGGFYGGYRARYPYGGYRGYYGRGYRGYGGYGGYGGCAYGFMFDPSIGACVPIAPTVVPGPTLACPPGQVIDPSTSQCVASAGGFTAEEGPVRCPAGYGLNQETRECEKLAESPAPAAAESGPGPAPSAVETAEASRAMSSENENASMSSENENAST